MAATPLPTTPLTPIGWIGRHIFAALAVAALVAAVGLWYWFNQTKVENLRLGAGVELKNREGATDILGKEVKSRESLADILCGEATSRDLKIEVQWKPQTLDAVQQVDKHDLDAAIIPASLSIPAENVRQVTMLDCETLHLFVKAELYDQGLAGLRGHKIFMGQPGTGLRCVAEQILQITGLTGCTPALCNNKELDNKELAELIESPTTSLEAMPDAVFSLSPLPSSRGMKLVRRFGYQLLELPMGEALALRHPCFEDIQIPADTYSASPAVPRGPIHSIGIRSVLIAHRNVPSLAIERMLEVFYESDYARRASMKQLDPALLQRSRDYPLHAGTMAYIHRNDPWPLQKLLTKLQGLIGSTISVLSAILLAWHWIRRKKVDVGAYQQECSHLDLDSQRAACQGEFGEAELSACLAQLARLKAEVLEQYRPQFLSGDKDVVDVVTRIEGLQKLLPSLVHTKTPLRKLSLDFGPPHRKAS